MWKKISFERLKNGDNISIVQNDTLVIQGRVLKDLDDIIFIVSRGESGHHEAKLFPDIFIEQTFKNSIGNTYKKQVVDPSIFIYCYTVVNFHQEDVKDKVDIFYG